jgi:hypothetical protein
MNMPLYVATLRGQNESVGQLSAEIATHLRELEQMVSERNPRIATETLDRLAALHRCLCIEAETFCKRLHLLLEEAEIADDTAVKITHKGASF